MLSLRTGARRRTLGIWRREMNRPLPQWALVYSLCRSLEILLSKKRGQHDQNEPSDAHGDKDGGNCRTLRTNRALAIVKVRALLADFAPSTGTNGRRAVSYTHLRAHETLMNL
eukprot:36593-Prymnesium_polylepis.2